MGSQEGRPMNEQKTWSQRFNELPRAGKWALVGTVGIIGLLLYFDYILTMAGGWNEDADRIRSQVSQAAVSSTPPFGIERMTDLISGVGPVVGPANEADANAALTQSVNEIIKRHSVSNDDFKIRPPALLPTGTLEKIIKGNEQRVERLTGELRFEASPQHTLAIISELEGSEDIESVSHVRLNKMPGTRKLSVQLRVEAWILSNVTRRGAGASR